VSDGPPIDDQHGGRRLVLLRHAKSDWPDVADQDRPLAKRGRRDAPAVGRWLGQSGYAPDAVICSTALRARETWELASAGLRATAPGAFPTAAVAVLAVPGAWADTAPGEAGLVAFAIPADMRS
jgi:phosphohistidine phosphatase SixA